MLPALASQTYRLTGFALENYDGSPAEVRAPVTQMPCLTDVLTVDVDWIFSCLTLAELSCSRAASSQMRTLLTATWTRATNRLSSGTISAEDVAAGTHATALRWMVCNASIARITLHPGFYTLGDDCDPRHVDHVFGEEEIEHAREEGRCLEPSWKPGFGPLSIRRNLVMAGGTVNGRCGNTTIKLFSAAQDAINIGQCSASGARGACLPLNVRIESVRILTEECCVPSAAYTSRGGCLHIETRPPGDLGGLGQPFTGPLLHLKNCTLSGPTHDLVWCDGRVIFEDVTFVDGGPPPGGGIVIGHRDCLVYVVMDGNLVDILHDLRAVWVPSPTRTVADAKLRSLAGHDFWTPQQLRDRIRATYRLSGPA